MYKSSPEKETSSIDVLDFEQRFALSSLIKNNCIDVAVESTASEATGIIAEPALLLGADTDRIGSEDRSTVSGVRSEPYSEHVVAKGVTALLAGIAPENKI
ncbi:hypothetical protein CORC01_07834 [Colletotrichum orchidophilum]|uniref:Uncharacterized protein n=1 Tax=Colletotrichum orchidophilum TaxID=1209926 RepID=A0A1G4B628_9PEZI|nr:uncharacterized protein CORC01_07834 [Colletotrichum orchidophilum]OHE96867.1 hypothetical protein CORC01_07834 [Colletotrichum orchidophilum]